MTYDLQFIKDSLHLLQDQLIDLETWSAYNDDQYNEEIIEIKKHIDALQKKVREHGN